MYYRKKPVVIQAIQLTWRNWCDICDFVGPLDETTRGCYIDSNGNATESVTDTIGMTIKTLEGVMLARQTDWVIKGVMGEFYPCRDDIFQKTYEAMETIVNN